MAENRPEITPQVDLWLHTPEKTVFYIDTCGHTSALRAEHLSTTTVEVVSGSGIVTTGRIPRNLEIGDSLEIKKNVAHRYSGNMALLVTLEPGIIDSDFEPLDGNCKRHIGLAKYSGAIRPLIDEPLYQLLSDYEQDYDGS